MHSFCKYFLIIISTDFVNITTLYIWTLSTAQKCIWWCSISLFPFYVWEDILLRHFSKLCIKSKDSIFLTQKCNIHMMFSISSFISLTLVFFNFGFSLFAAVPNNIKRKILKGIIKSYTIVLLVRTDFKSTFFTVDKNNSAYHLTPLFLILSFSFLPL